VAQRAHCGYVAAWLHQGAVLAKPVITDKEAGADTVVSATMIKEIGEGTEERSPTAATLDTTAEVRGGEDDTAVPAKWQEEQERGSTSATVDTVLKAEGEKECGTTALAKKADEEKEERGSITATRADNRAERRRKRKGKREQKEQLEPDLPTGTRLRGEAAGHGASVYTGPERYRRLTRAASFETAEDEGGDQARTGLTGYVPCPPPAQSTWELKELKLKELKRSVEVELSRRPRVRKASEDWESAVKAEEERAAFNTFYGGPVQLGTRPLSLPARRPAY
jgi:hypothetical protein